MSIVRPSPKPVMALELRPTNFLQVHLIANYRLISIVSLFDSEGEKSCI